MNSRAFVLAWVEAYEKALGVKYVAKKLNTSVASASAKANSLRKRGVELPIMRCQKEDPYSTEELNDLIASKLTK